MVDLKPFKSLEVVKEGAKIEKLLLEAHEKVAKEHGNKATLTMGTTLTKEDDRLVVQKCHRFGSTIRDAKGFVFGKTVDQLKALAAKRNIPWVEGYEQRVVPYYASDERVDRHGDIVEQSWDFADYESNPLFLYSHEWDLPPIGNALEWEVIKRTDGQYNGDALAMLCLFAGPGAWDWADVICRLTLAGFLRTVSVGFSPGEVVIVNDKEERDKLGLGPYGYILRENSLIELSPTSVPANPGAHTLSTLKAGAKSGLVKASDLNVVRELNRRAIEPTGDNKLFKHLDGNVLTLWQGVFSGVKATSAKIDEPVLESADRYDEIVEMLKDVNVRSQASETAIEDIRSMLEAGPSSEPAKGGDPTKASLSDMFLEEMVKAGRE